MEVLINGDIYIKRNPDYVENTFEEIEANTMIIDMHIKQLEDRCKVMENIKSESSDEDWWKDSITKKILNSTYERIEYFQQKKMDIIEKGNPNYNGYYSFWVLILSDDGIKMVDQSNDKKSVKTYKTIENMKNDFISLKELLSTAKFEGRQFSMGLRISESFCVSINPYDNPIYGPILTHSYGDRGIIYIPNDMDINDIPKKEGYEFVDLGDFLSNTSRISPIVHNEFNNPSELYQQIFKQIHSQEEGKKYIK